MTKRLGYTITEFAELSGFGRTKIFEAIKEKKLRAKRLGRRRIILEEEARRFLEDLPEDAGDSTAE